MTRRSASGAGQRWVLPRGRRGRRRQHAAWATRDVRNAARVAPDSGGRGRAGNKVGDAVRRTELAGPGAGGTGQRRAGPRGRDSRDLV
ncbi:hypothetical protein [Actinoallomurus sp. NPDC050550]|uniref:hypothetical protein n=1 Tax=Actinoallomurus sp. NPDC050550 TaxID=3154937 RepID=UPI0033CD9D00